MNSWTNFIKKVNAAEEKSEKEDEQTDISSLSVEELKKAKSNAKSKITKAKKHVAVFFREQA